MSSRYLLENKRKREISQQVREKKRQKDSEGTTTDKGVRQRINERRGR
jgi:hypothetical protein